MHRLNNIIICLAFLTTTWPLAVYSIMDWDLNFLRFEFNTSDRKVADFDFHVKRTKNGEYAVNGSFVLGVDIDDTYSASLKVYRSESGSSQYRNTPYEVPTTPFYSFMTTLYVKMLQNVGMRCSNMPYHENNFDTPLAKGTYNLNMCVISNERMPPHMQPGFYKVIAYFSNENAQLYMTGFGEIFSKNNFG